MNGESLFKLYVDKVSGTELQSYELKASNIFNLSHLKHILYFDMSLEI